MHEEMDCEEDLTWLVSCSEYPENVAFTGNI